MDFNGLVRHYYLRREPHRGDLRVNLLAKDNRAQQSHALVLRLRNQLEEVARRHGARIKLIEVPPGPPVLSTLVAEVYPRAGQSSKSFRADTEHVHRLFAEEPGVVDVDDTFEAERSRFAFRVDKEKASLAGISTEDIALTLQMPLRGISPGEGNLNTARAGAGHSPHELNPLMIVLQVSPANRSNLSDLTRLAVKAPSGELIRLGELGRFEELPAEQTIYHKNQRRVAYVTGDTAGRTPAEAILGMQQRLKKNRCRMTPNSFGPAKANGKSRSTCFAIWDSLSAAPCSSSTS